MAPPPSKGLKAGRSLRLPGRAMPPSVKGLSAARVRDAPGLGPSGDDLFVLTDVCDEPWEAGADHMGDALLLGKLEPDESKRSCGGRVYAAGRGANWSTASFKKKGLPDGRNPNSKSSISLDEAAPLRLYGNKSMNDKRVLGS